MEDVDQSSGGAPENVGDVQKEERQESVDYRSYEKAVTEAKKAKEAARDLQAQFNEVSKKLGEFETAKMEEQGKHSEVIAQLRQQNAGLESKLQEQSTAYQLGQIKNAIQSEAVKQGCTNIDALMRLVDAPDVKGIEVRDDFSVNTDDVANLVDGYKKKYDGLNLFKRQAAKIYDAPASNKPMTSGKSIAEMSSDELSQEIKKRFS